MNVLQARQKIEELLCQAGVSIDGPNPWDIKVYDEKFYVKALTEGSLGVGESYMQSWWDCSRLDEFFSRILRIPFERVIKDNWWLLIDIAFSRLFNPQSISRSFRLGQKHYDLGNDLFVQMLDKRMVYTCAYWRNATNLDEAQENKLDLTCRKLDLRPGLHVLDIGCGWGSFAKYAAEKYDVKVTGITISREQQLLGNEMCKGLPVEIKLMDYRQIHEKYDRIISLGMFEHVGCKNYRTYMKVAHRALKNDGILLLHTIGSRTSSTWTDPWINKYIFPGSLLPSITQIGKSIEDLFVMEDWHNFGADYDLTLLAWYRNFKEHWNEIRAAYGDAFYRMWSYYLLICAGSFRARKNQLWQIVLSKNGIPNGYQAVR
jgi:cyclopropane-fatty-acyl-phospholipid synthase